jgi:hypothetical protein
MNVWKLWAFISVELKTHSVLGDRTSLFGAKDMSAWLLQPNAGMNSSMHRQEIALQLELELQGPWPLA